MNLDFSEIQEIEKSIGLADFEDLFSRLERNAFLLRGNSTDFYIFLGQFFDKNNVDNTTKVMLLKCLVEHKGNWKHDFLVGLYESLKEPEINEQNNFNISDTDFELVKSLVDVKIQELNTFREVRYALEIDNKVRQVTRVSYEGQQIANYFNNGSFSRDFIITYLECLKNKIISEKINIYDNLPHEIPNVTKDFLNWINEQLALVRLKQTQSKEIKSNKKQYPFYCQVGILFAKGQIQFKNQKFYFCNKPFVSIAKLSKYIKEEVLKTDKSVRQYINDTIYNTGTKSFYKSYTMMKKIVDYCNDNSIEITTEFQDIYDELEKLH